MRVRPTSVTVIGWFLVVTALLSLPNDIRSLVRPRASAAAAKSPVPPPIQQAISWLATVMNFVCGYFLLKGRNWARLAQITWSFSMFAYGFFASPYPAILLMGIAIECLVIYLLFRPQANAFFAVQSAGQPIQNELSSRQIASVCCYIAAGGFIATNMLIALMFPKEFSPLLFIFFLGAMSVMLFIVLLIGRWLSPSPNWPREMGIVLLASAAAATAFQLVLAVVFWSTAFQKSLPPGKSLPELNFAAAAVAVAAVAATGGLMWWMGNRRSRSDRRQVRRLRQ